MELGQGQIRQVSVQAGQGEGAVVGTIHLRYPLTFVARFYKLAVVKCGGLK